MSKFYKVNGSKYAINHDFFKSINSEEQAYLLGFYVADGNINEKRKTFRIKISKEDQEIIEMYKKEISPNARIIEVNPYVIKGRNEKEYISNPQAIIDINSAIIVKSLVSLGYGYNKTYSNLNLPNLSEDLLIHFIRGYFDGNGGIDTNSNKMENVKIAISSGSRMFLEELRSYLFKNGINSYIFQEKPNAYRLNIGGVRNADNMWNYMYENSHIFLDRKFIKKETLYKKYDIAGRLLRLSKRVGCDL